MKTLTFIITVVLALQANVMLASGLNPRLTAKETNALIKFAPSLPGVATYTDAVPEPDFSGLAPVSPAEAMFEDALTPILEDLIPTLPTVADFEDTDDHACISHLAPVLPTEAEYD